jgi:hypothetical protein
VFIIKKALYGSKSAGAAFRALLAETLYNIGYVPSRADPDVWLRPTFKPDGFEYYEMVLCYVDDILSISHDPESSLWGLQSTFKLKDDKVEEPEMYLGAQLGKMQIDADCWTMSSDKYVSAAVPKKMLKNHLRKRDYVYPQSVILCYLRTTVLN